VCGDRAVSEWTLTGTMDGKRLEVRGCDLFELVGGKISRKDSYWKIVDSPDGRARVGAARPRSSGTASGRLADDGGGCEAQATTGCGRLRWRADRALFLLNARTAAAGWVHRDEARCQ
jgi:hypothetical protein